MVASASMARRLSALWAALSAVVLALSMLAATGDALAQRRVPAGPRPAASASASASAPAVTSAAPVVAPVKPAPVVAPADVKVRERLILTLRASRGGHDPAWRAKEANGALEAVLANPDELPPVTVKPLEGGTSVLVGTRPILSLGPEDVSDPETEPLDLLASPTAAKIDDALKTERKRAELATTVFSLSLVVFSALLAFLLLGRMSDLSERLRAWVMDNPDRVAGIRLGNVEFLSPGAARGAAAIAVTLGHRFLQVSIAYGWLLFVLSLFKSTRDYTERLTGLLVRPLYALASRVGAALPAVVIAAIAFLAITVLLRFIGLFFDSVARGETRIAWLPRDLAKPTAVLARFAVVLFSLAVASPLLTGNEDGALSRAGLMFVVGVALSATPVMATAAAGVVALFGRRLTKGHFVDVGGSRGKLVDVNLLELRLEDDAGCELRVPHLLALVRPLRIGGAKAQSRVDVVVADSVDAQRAETVLRAAVRELGTRGTVELYLIDREGAHFRVNAAAPAAEESVGVALARALTRAGIAFGPVGARPTQSTEPLGATDDDEGAA